MNINYSTATQSVEKPIISSIISEKATMVIGTASRGLEVLIYFDGQFVGIAKSSKQNETLDKFFYQYHVSINDGLHNFMAIARDKTSLVLSPPSTEVKFNTGVALTPTLIAPKNNSYVGNSKPLIKGLTANNTFVRFYIDGIYNGQTAIVSHNSGTANFAYKPFLELGVGWHNVWAIAETKSGKKSKISSIISFKVEKPIPAPIVLKAVVNNQTTSNQPFIVGLAKNNSTVNVFIDQKINGKLNVKNHKSGTASFAYKSLPLTNGQHLVYTQAINANGKESAISNKILFTVKQSGVVKGTQEKQINKQKPVVKVKKATLAKVISPNVPKKKDSVKKVSKKPAKPIVEKKKETIVKEEKIDNEIEQIINEKIEKQEEQSSAVNENKESQTKPKLNLLIFLLFILIVIAWMFWINRRLIKERREQNEENVVDSNKDNKQ